METEAGDTMTFSIAATESMLPDGRMAHPPVADPHVTGRGDGVLPGEVRVDPVHGHAESGGALAGDLDVDGLRVPAENGHLAHVLDGEEAGRSDFA